MKIRNGFVSNSSSTSFTFIFKGSTMEDLYALIRKYNQYFDLYFQPYEEPEMHCTAEDVITAIKDCEVTSTRKQYGKDFVNLHTLEYFMEGIGNDIELIENDPILGEEYSFREKMEKMELKMGLEEKQKSGFNIVYKIGFGDNDGDVCGGDVGITMDYEGRNIVINKPDFIVITEQNR